MPSIAVAEPIFGIVIGRSLYAVTTTLPTLTPSVSLASGETLELEAPALPFVEASEEDGVAVCANVGIAKAKMAKNRYKFFMTAAPLIIESSTKKMQNGKVH